MPERRSRSRREPASAGYLVRAGAVVVLLAPASAWAQALDAQCAASKVRIDGKLPGAWIEPVVRLCQQLATLRDIDPSARLRLVPEGDRLWVEVALSDGRSARRRVNEPGELPITLLARVAQGDVEVLGMLYDRYAPSLMRFARRLERSEAEDIVQTVFLRVLRLAAGFDCEVASARPWLYAITLRVAQERRRSTRRWVLARLRFGEQRFKAAPEISDTRPDLARGLCLLSSAKRTVLLLAEVEGFSCEEIASMMSIPVGTVWTRLHHARLELRRFHQQDGV